MCILPSKYDKDRRNLKTYVFLVRNNIHLTPPPPTLFHWNSSHCYAIYTHVSTAVCLIEIIQLIFIIFLIFPTCALCPAYNVVLDLFTQRIQNNNASRCVIFDLKNLHGFMVIMFVAPSKRTFGLELPRREVHITCEHFRDNRRTQRQTCMYFCVLLFHFCCWLFRVSVTVTLTYVLWTR